MADLVRSGRLVWIVKVCRAAGLQHGTVSSIELVMYRTQCIFIFNLFSFPEFISFYEGACISNNFLARNIGAILDIKLNHGVGIREGLLNLFAQHEISLYFL